MRCSSIASLVGVLVSCLSACHDVPKGTSQRVFGAERPTELLLPEGIGNGAEAPLLVALHAYGSDGSALLEYTGLLERAAAAGVLLVAPNGLLDSGGSAYWNGGACCDFDGTGVDDAAYVIGLADDIASVWPVSTINVIGFEAGGFLAYELGCRFGNRLSSIISIGGAGSFDVDDCVESEIGAVHIHGDADAVINYEGTDEYPGALASVARVAVASGCGPLPTVVDRVDLDEVVEGAETRVARFPGCSATVELWTRERSMHLPPLSSEFAEHVLEMITD